MVMSAWATSTFRAALENWFIYLGEGIYVPGEVARVSETRFLWPCTCVWGRGAEDVSSTYSEAVGCVHIGNLIRSNKK